MLFVDHTSVPYQELSGVETLIRVGLSNDIHTLFKFKDVEDNYKPMGVCSCMVMMILKMTGRVMIDIVLIGYKEL